MQRLFFMAMLMILVAGCTAGGDSTPTAPAAGETPAGGGTAAPATQILPPTQTPEGYPGATVPEIQATSAYPADAEFWLVRPAGLQCEDPAYPDLRAAVTALEDAGITVLESEEMNLAVCEACGCPTPQHYRVKVSGADLPKAQPLGWIIEQ